jgi:oxygen-dependent protoporphyrinogen oxidase
MTESRSVKPHVAVIGAGASGLAAARRCAQLGASVTLLERESRIGGRVRNIDVDGHLVDVGSQFIASFSDDLLGAIKGAGGNEELEAVSQKTAVVRNGSAWEVAGIGDLARGGLMSRRSRLRMPALALPLASAWRKLDPVHLARGADLDDSSALELLKQWSGEEVAEAFIAPLLKGLLYWELETTSQAVLLAMLKSSAQGSQVFRAPEGMEKTLARLGEGIEVRLGTAVLEVKEGEGGCELRVLGPSGECELAADGVVCATTAPAALEVIADPPPPLERFLRSVSYSKTALSVFRLPAGTSIPLCSHLFPAQTTPLLASVNPPQGRAARREVRFMRIALSDPGYKELGSLDDEELTSRSLTEVQAVDPDSAWTAEAEPVGCVRWEEALPRFDVGYLRQAPLQDPAAAGTDRVALAGDYLMAPHLEGAFRSGEAAANQLIAKLAATESQRVSLS